MTVRITRARWPAASAVALIAALPAAPALADVTAQQVWEDYQQSFGFGGSNVTTGAVEEGNGTVTVRDLAFNSTDPQGGTASGTLPELTFTENGDGTVTVTMSPEFPITVTTPADAATGSAASEVSLALRQEGFQMVASGDPGAITYDLSADRYALELVSATENGQPLDAQGSLALNGFTGTYATTGAAPADGAAGTRSTNWDLAAASVDVALDLPSTTDSSRFNLSGQIAQLASQGTGTIPVNGAPETMLQGGLALDGGYSYGGAKYSFDVTDATGGTTTGTASTGAGSLDLALGADSMTYTSNVSTVALDATAAQMPFPISAQIAEYGLNVQVPLSQTDAPAPWALGVTMDGLALNDEVWGLFDPQAQLPRDPATLRVALSGTATLNADLTDTAAQDAMAASGAAPGQIDSVSIDELELSIAGASVTGAGSFTLDNTDMTTFAGIPRPTGSAEFQLTGVNTLIQTLGTMGLLPQDQLMGAQMMLGMFATPTGDDQLTSRVEVTPDAQLLVNGQRLQ